MDEPRPFAPGDLVVVTLGAGALEFLARVARTVPVDHSKFDLEILHAIAYGPKGERFFFPAPARETRRVTADALRLLDPAPPSPPSSNGRTADFGSADGGSNPPGGTAPLPVDGERG